MSTINTRIKEIIDTFCDGNNTEFANKVSTSEANVRNYIKGRAPKFDLIEQIAKNFEISYEWLLLGKGEMLLENQQSPTDTNSAKSTDAKFEDLLVDLLSSPKAKKVINHLITERLTPITDNIEVIDAYLAQQVLDKLKGEE